MKNIRSVATELLDQSRKKLTMNRGMHYLEGLNVIHQNLNPKNYLEIGCRFGDSLALANCPSIGVDPTLRINKEVTQEHKLFELTSDDFFDKEDSEALLGGPISFAFIDGMHLAEYALRDFINIESLSSPDTIVAFDDVLPKKNEWAQREIIEKAWCGDVYKVFRVLKAYRPDLDIRVYDISTKGLGVIHNLDRNNNVLRKNLQQIEADLIGDKYVIDNVLDLRKEFEVRPITALGSDIQELAKSVG